MFGRRRLTVAQVLGAIVMGAAPVLFREGVRWVERVQAEAEGRRRAHDLLLADYRQAADRCAALTAFVAEGGTVLSVPMTALGGSVGEGGDGDREVLSISWPPRDPNNRLEWPPGGPAFARDADGAVDIISMAHREWGRGGVVLDAEF